MEKTPKNAKTFPQTTTAHKYLAVHLPKFPDQSKENPKRKKKNEMGKHKQEMFDYFTKSKITPARLTKWLAEATNLLCCTESLTNEERSCSGTFLWWIGYHFMPVFIDTNSSQEALTKALWEAFTLGDDYDDYREGISNIGIAYLAQKAAQARTL